MWRCPICETENGAQTLCRGCGFDNSLNVLAYPTLAPGVWDLDQFRPTKRKRWGTALRAALACPACGGMTFHILPEVPALVCAFCGAGLLRPRAAEAEVLCENGRIRTRKRPGERLSEAEAAALRDILLTFTDPMRAAGGSRADGILGDLLGFQDLQAQLIPPLREGVELACGRRHIAVLLEDGCVRAYGSDINESCRVEGWRDIRAIAAAFYVTFGLTGDGRVVSAGKLEPEERQELEQWRDIRAIAAGRQFLAGLHGDGTVSCAGKWDWRGETWTHIRAISAGSYHLLGLREDGTVLAAGSYGSRALDTAAWRDVTHIAAGHNFSAALRADGAILCTAPDVELGRWKAMVLKQTGM